MLNQSQERGAMDITLMIILRDQAPSLLELAFYLYLKPKRTYGRRPDTFRAISLR
jgi:hypothetical protein